MHQSWRAHPAIRLYPPEEASRMAHEILFCEVEVAHSAPAFHVEGITD
ncbi:hypothetical protein MMEU_0944 [Mycobacterium marinum str. Europe]|nr:hypothetical protein MMEU_0944 [Mycobacterium marinum str. Europe]